MPLFMQLWFCKSQRMRRQEIDQQLKERLEAIDREAKQNRTDGYENKEN
jgi:hypothetical protein